MNREHVPRFQMIFQALYKIQFSYGVRVNFLAPMLDLAQDLMLQEGELLQRLVIDALFYIFNAIAQSDDTLFGFQFGDCDSANIFNVF